MRRLRTRWETRFGGGKGQVGQMDGEEGHGLKESSLLSVGAMKM
jgi:hypothetical protein